MDIYATELMGAKTYDVARNYVGRVREFFIEPAEAPNRVSHYLLSRGHFQPLVAKHNQVASVAAGKMELSVSERALELYQPNESWLAVQKDLLDQQIIDTRGRKVVRVNDVDLTPFRTNGNVELRLTHEKLEDLHPADLAEIMEDLSAAERQGIIASLDEETAAAVLAELDERLTTQIVEKLDPEKAADILEEMAPDAAADLLADLSRETSEELLDEMPGQVRQKVGRRVRGHFFQN